MENIKKKENPRVLIVHNESREGIRGVIALTRIGCIVQEAFGLRSAFSMWKYPTFHDVIFVDHIFRQGNAVEFAGAIRKMEKSYNSQSMIIGVYTSVTERKEMENAHLFSALLMGPLEGHLDLLRQCLISEERTVVLQEASRFDEIQRVLQVQSSERRQSAEEFLGELETSQEVVIDVIPTSRKSVASVEINRVRVAESEVSRLGKWKRRAMREMARVQSSLAAHEISRMRLEDRDG